MIATEPYNVFSAQLQRAMLRERVPSSGTIEVSRRCNLTCAHCYNNLAMDDEARHDELTLDEYCRLIDEIVDEGCFWLLFSGGEIFARRDFLEIYDYARGKGMLITLFTNGTLVTPRIADHLAASPPFAIEVTLYGRTQETYERLTGIPGSFEKCIRGIELLRERGLPLAIKTVATTINKHEVFEMARFAEEDLGIKFKFDSMINPRIDCSQAPVAIRLSPAEVVELDLRDPRRAHEWVKFADFFRPIDRKVAEDDTVYKCGGGVNSFAVDPLGNLSICVLSHQDTYDLRRGSFRDGWREFIDRVRYGTQRSMETKCVSCAMKSTCGMCPANGELESGHKEKPVEFLCQTAHLRAEVLGFSVLEHGDCEYCPGGRLHDWLKRTAEEVRARVAGSWNAVPSQPRALPVLGATEGAVSGCGSCR